MTVKELKEMISKYTDDTELMFIVEDYDKDGYPTDVNVDVYKIVSTNAKSVRHEYGIYRYED